MSKKTIFINYYNNGSYQLAYVDYLQNVRTGTGVFTYISSLNPRLKIHYVQLLSLIYRMSILRCKDIEQISWGHPKC